MTTVAAIARDGVVHMAGDMLTNIYDRPMPGSARKILRGEAVGGAELLFGVSGDGALLGLIDAELDVPRPPRAGADPQRWAHQIAIAVTRIAVEHSVVDEGRLSGCVLLGFAGRVWTLTHAQAIPHPDGVAAIGSGEGLAIGALDALLGMGVEPRGALLRAVSIAAARDRYTGEPVQEETLEAPTRPSAARKASEKRG